MRSDEEIAHLALDTAIFRGGSYVDVRISKVEEENIEVKNGRPELVRTSNSEGFGVRVLIKGAWGFASSADLTHREAERIGALAVEIAESSAAVRRSEVVLAPVEAIKDTYRTPVELDPFNVSFDEKMTYLLSLGDIMKQVKDVQITRAFMDFRRVKHLFISSEGSLIRQELVNSGAGVAATAMRGHQERQTRSYPCREGQHGCRGYELIGELNLEEEAQRTAEEAAALLSAKESPRGRKKVIFDGSLISLLIHESIGHPLELDRVLGSEVNFSGTSFATLDKLNRLRYASECVSVVADATTPGGLGSFGYDDEGVAARQIYLIRDGLLVGYLTSRETAHLIGQRSSGAMRADGWGNVPLIRMTNTNLIPGKFSFQELLDDIDDGLFLATPASWSIDESRESFQFGAEIGWEIRRGKLGDMVKNPTFRGRTVNFWNTCRAIANLDHWKLWGTPNCGKGQPGQRVRVGQGASPARFDDVEVGE